MINYPMLAAQVLNQPLMLDPGYARVFFAALAPRLGANLLVDAGGQMLGPDEMQAVADSYYHPVTGEARTYRIENGVAVLPISGALAHKTGNVRPRSGLQGYDGIQRMLEQAATDTDVKGVLLDIHSPGGQVAGAFDTADMIRRVAGQKPVWALANDLNASAAQLLAAAADRRLVTQTGTVGSIGVVVAHGNYEQALENEGVEITLIHSGSHKVEGNPYQALPAGVKTRWQKKIDATRKLFAEKVAGFTRMSLDAVLDTEAATYSGREAVEIGLADELINSIDAVNLMADHVNHQKVYAMPKATTPATGQAAKAAAENQPQAWQPEQSPVAKLPQPSQQEGQPAAPAAETPTSIAAAAPVEAAALIAACEQAGMINQVGNLAKQQLTQAQLETRLEQLGELRDTLAAASLSDQFDAMATQLDKPVELVRCALAHATAHREQSEVAATAPVNASTSKQPDHQAAYGHPESL